MTVAKLSRFAAAADRALERGDLGAARDLLAELMLVAKHGGPGHA